MPVPLVATSAPGFIPAQFLGQNVWHLAGPSDSEIPRINRMPGILLDPGSLFHGRLHPKRVRLLNVIGRH